MQTDLKAPYPNYTSTCNINSINLWSLRINGKIQQERKDYSLSIPFPRKAVSETLTHRDAPSRLRSNPPAHVHRTGCIMSGLSGFNCLMQPDREKAKRVSKQYASKLNQHCALGTF